MCQGDATINKEELVKQYKKIKKYHKSNLYQIKNLDDQ